MNPAKKGMKIFKEILTTVFLLFILFLLVMFVYHRITCKQEFDTLKDFGYVNNVMAEDYSLNLTSYGNRYGKHTIVTISGMENSEYSCTMRKVTDHFEDDNLIVFIDRSGYSLSDDSFQTPTASRVVDNYRKALENAHIEAPYVLLSNGIGGAYATYWESKYPDEIQGVVFMDTTPLSENDAFDESFTNPGSFSEFMDIAQCKTGICRLMPEKYMVHLPSAYSDTEKKLSQALYNNNGKSIFMKNERHNANSICREAFDNLTTNDIPKLYIESSCFKDFKELKEYAKWLEAEDRTSVMPIAGQSDYELQQLVSEYEKEYDEVLLPYVEKLGHCRFSHIAGDSRIYEVKPKEVAGQIMRLLETIPAVEKKDDDAKRWLDGKPTVNGKVKEDKASDSDKTEEKN